MSDIVVWGIPTCSTVQKARAWLDAQRIPHAFADLRATPPSKDVVGRWVTTLGAKALRNTSGASYRALPATKDGWSDAQWTDAFAKDPMLIKRPVVEKAGAAVAVGFRAAELGRALGL